MNLLLLPHTTTQIKLQIKISYVQEHKTSQSTSRVRTLLRQRG